jgi:hypothetical protein
LRQVTPNGGKIERKLGFEWPRGVRERGSQELVHAVTGGNIDAGNSFEI